MSSTNKTVTIELSQYVSTDKPTYLVDYNSDMLKIDNAIASDRGDITTAQNTATTADGKADANKTSIDNINLQLNGDPTDPADTGLAGDVSAVEGSVNTINSLIGNGTPTTSDQTIIGAINNLEGSVAPREDSANMANSYVIGAKFARGGTVYEALSSITAGTAFASLVLNTDYKVADTLVKQIEDAASGSGVLTVIVNSVEESIAPREDGTTLTGSYAENDQFIRAGVLYEALTSLTAGTTFASLTLNTDYKVADTLIEQIANAGGAVSLDGYYMKSRSSVEVTGDGVKTAKEVNEEVCVAFKAVANAIANDELIVVTAIDTMGSYQALNGTPIFDNTATSTGTTFHVFAVTIENSELKITKTILSAVAAYNKKDLATITTTPAVTLTDLSTRTVPNGVKTAIEFEIYKKFPTT